MEKIRNDLPLQLLKLQSKGIIRFARISEIVYCKADDNYTTIILNDQSKFTICKTLKSFETKLGNSFLRCHKTYLVNLLYVKGINKKNHTIILKNGLELPFSRTFSAIIAGRLEKNLNNSFYPFFNTVYPVSNTIQ